MKRLSFIVPLLVLASLGRGQDMFPIRTSPGVSDGQQIFDTNHVLSGDFGTRQLLSLDGSQPLVDWNDYTLLVLGGGILSIDTNSSNITFTGVHAQFNGDIIINGGFLDPDQNLIGISAGGPNGWRWQSSDGGTYFDNTGFHGSGLGLTQLVVDTPPPLNTFQYVNADSVTLSTGTGFALVHNGSSSWNVTVQNPAPETAGKMLVITKQGGLGTVTVNANSGSFTRPKGGSTSAITLTGTTTVTTVLVAGNGAWNEVIEY